MSIMTGHLLGANPLRWWSAFTRSLVTVAAILTDAVVIIAAAVLMGAAYHMAVYGDRGPWINFFEIGVVATTIFVLPSAIHGDYSLAHYLSFKPHVRRVFTLWNVTFLCLLTLGFLAKMTDIYSRGTMILSSPIPTRARTWAGPVTSARSMRRLPTPSLYVCLTSVAVLGAYDWSPTPSEKLTSNQAKAIAAAADASARTVTTAPAR